MKSKVVSIEEPTIARPRDRAAAGAADERNNADPEFLRLSQDTFALMATTAAKSTLVVCVSKIISVNAGAAAAMPQLIFSRTTMRLLFAGLRRRTPLCAAATAAVLCRSPKR